MDFCKVLMPKIYQERWTLTELLQSKIVIYLKRSDVIHSPLVIFESIYFSTQYFTYAQS